MGRFDELQQLDVLPPKPQPPEEENRSTREEKTRKPANGQIGKLAPLQNHSPTKPQGLVSASLQTRKPVPSRLPAIAGEIPEKYTTRLHPSMVRRVKVFAAERDINDYEVVEKALTEYFERNT